MNNREKLKIAEKMVFREGRMLEGNRIVFADCNGHPFGRIKQYEQRGYGTGKAKIVFEAAVLDKYLDRYDFQGSYDTAFEAKLRLAELASEEERSGAKNIKYLPSSEDAEFYPTPGALAQRMFKLVDWKKATSILEPSAGKGDLIEAYASYAANRACGKRWRGSYISENDLDTYRNRFDVIEKDDNLRMMLKGMGRRIVGDDFLDFRTNKVYDLILMNPPFSNGDEHLLHAISLQKHGGQIACILNAETIRNPYTNRRKLLKQLLAEYGAYVEFVEGAFKRSERPSDVEVAIVVITIPRDEPKSNVLDDLVKAKSYKGSEYKPNAMIRADSKIMQMIEQYNFEAKAGIEFLKQYEAFAPYMENGAKEYSKPLIQLQIGHDYYSGATTESINSYLKLLRGKYWRMFLDRPEVRSRLTSDMASEYSSKVDAMKEYEFDEYNVMQVMYDINIQLQGGVEDSIMKLFDKLSEKHSWYPECENNIHYYNGWKTNQAHKVGMKVILPINGYSSWGYAEKKIHQYEVAQTISDLERAMRFLDNGDTSFWTDVSLAIQRANEKGSKTCEFTFFDATFYKKGTCHIRFHDDARRIIDRLNIFAAQNRNWLPPYYGKVRYEDMDAEGKAVVDEFQGREAYEKVCDAPEQYILEARKIAMLSAG